MALDLLSGSIAQNPLQSITHGLNLLGPQAESQIHLQDNGKLTNYRDEYEKYWARWTTRWQHCNALCLGYIALDMTVIIVHWHTMIVQLYDFADGNVLLLGMTFMSTWMSLMSIMLMIGEPAWMMAPKWQRQVVFIYSMLSVATFNAQFFGVIYEYFNGDTPFDTISEMNSAYLLVLRFANFVPALYIFLYEGLGQSRYSIFNKDYGNWSDVDLRDKDDQTLWKMSSDSIPF